MTFWLYLGNLPDVVMIHASTCGFATNRKTKPEWRGHYTSYGQAVDVALNERVQHGAKVRRDSCVDNVLEQMEV